MELRGIVDPPVCLEGNQSAHQFSARSVSLQADSIERNEIEMQTTLIDMKNDDR